MGIDAWTADKPNASGWYWIRAPKHGWRDCVLWVDQDDDGFYIDVGDCDTEYVTDIDAEWLGPISPTDRQQGRVAGLREAANRLCYLSAQDACSGDVLNEFGWWLKEQVEPQQAQEGGVGNANIKMS